jgi:hypothetical protein
MHALHGVIEETTQNGADAGSHHGHPRIPPLRGPLAGYGQQPVHNTRPQIPRGVQCWSCHPAPTQHQPAQTHHRHPSQFQISGVMDPRAHKVHFTRYPPEYYPGITDALHEYQMSISRVSPGYREFGYGTYAKTRRPINAGSSPDLKRTRSASYSTGMRSPRLMMANAPYVSRKVSAASAQKQWNQKCLATDGRVQNTMSFTSWSSVIRCFTLGPHAAFIDFACLLVSAATITKRPSHFSDGRVRAHKNHSRFQPTIFQTLTLAWCSLSMELFGEPFLVSEHAVVLMTCTIQAPIKRPTSSPVPLV